MGIIDIASSKSVWRGMDSTGYFEFDKLPAKCANSYIYCPDTKDYCTNIYSVGAKGTGDGGAFVTVEDIVKFWTGLCVYAGN